MSEPDVSRSAGPRPAWAAPDLAGAELPGAWQPFTPRGVAAFRWASLGRLMIVELIVAVLSAACVCWVVHTCWFPVIRQAIDQLPTEGEITGGQLHWKHESPQVLAGAGKLAIVVDLEESGRLGMTSDVQLELGRERWRLRGWLGALTLPYPRDVRVPFNRGELNPWWGAWGQAVLAGLSGMVWAGLLFLWACGALLLTGPAKGIAYLANRQLPWGGAWKLCSAALMPGAVIMMAALLGYGGSWLDLVRFGFAVVFHLAADLVYLFFGVLCLPLKSETILPKGNPFAAEDAREKKETSRGENPFRSP